MLNKQILYLSVLFLSIKLHCSNIDSVHLILKQCKADTCIAKTLYNLIAIEENDNWQTQNKQLYNLCINKLSNKALPKKDKLFYKSYLASCYSNFGLSFQANGNIDSALFYFDKGIEQIEQAHNINIFLNLYINKAYVFLIKGNFTESNRLYLIARDSAKAHQKYADVAICYNNIAMMYSKLGKVDIAEKYFKCVLVISRQFNLGNEISTVLINLAFIEKNKGNISGAIDLLLKAAYNAEQMSDSVKMPFVYNNLATIYSKLKDFQNAKKFYYKSMNMSKALNNEKTLCLAYSNLSSIFLNKGIIDSALIYVNKAIKIAEAKKDYESLASCNHYLGEIAMHQKDYQSALTYLLNGMKINFEHKNNYGLVVSYNKISLNYYYLNNYTEALLYNHKSISLAKQIGSLNDQKIAYRTYYKIYFEKKEYQNAFKYLKLFDLLKDSLNNTDLKKQAIKADLRLKYTHQLIQDSVIRSNETKQKNIEITRQKQQINEKAKQIYYLCAGGIIVLLFVAFIFYQFIKTKKQKRLIEIQKQIVEKQKNIIEEKQTEIIQSINYAKRIQTALLPNNKFIYKAINNLK